MALARGKVRMWYELSARSVSSLAGIPAGKMPVVEPLSELSREIRKLSVVEIARQSGLPGSQITERGKLTKSLPSTVKKSQPVPESASSSDEENMSQNIKRRPKLTLRKKRMQLNKAVAAREIDNLTKQVQFSLEITAPHAPAPESSLLCKQWLTSYFRVSDTVFQRRKVEMAEVLYSIFDRNVTKGRLGSRVSLEWTKRFNTTAGMTHFRMRKISRERYAGIVLSSKVLDSPLKLYRTLAHEMCHAAQWVIDAAPKPPHGAPFKAWVFQFRYFDPALDITTCHQYEINYKFQYECESCHQKYGRHSKSIDTDRKVCGNCRGKLHLLPSR